MNRPELKHAAIALLAVGPLVALLAAGTAAAQDATPGGASGIFDDRYCEILTVERRALKLHVTVYNTIGLNDCPAAAWDAIDADALARTLGVTAVIKNGPRHWTIDGIVGRGSSTANAPTAFGDVPMTQRATLERKLLGGMEDQNYTPQEVERDTMFVFAAGKPVFELTDPDGNVYMMQSYAQIVDPTLTLADLAGLGNRLALPADWSFSTRTLDAEYRLEADGVAYVVRDELQNTYQRR